jgi:pyruvate dehydrogenase E2 component (dihydrolipoamide acetyltransferase)
VAIEVIMPKLGMTMEEGTIIAWLRQEGEQLSEGEPLFEVETDKMITEVPAPASGVLRKVLAKPGSTLLVGRTVAIIAQPDEVIRDLSGPSTASVESLATVEPKQLSAPSVTETETSSDIPLKASPAAKKMAREHRVDLRSLAGSGPGGRILESDVMQVIKKLPPSATVAQDGTTKNIRSDQAYTTRFAKAEPVTLNSIRKRTAERMAESFRTIPHFYLTMEVLADRLVALREMLLEPVHQQAGVRLSYTDLLVKALASALRQHPEVNASWEQDGGRQNQDVNVAIAVATPDGLVVPVVHHADTLSIAEIAARRAALVEAARSRKLSLEVLEGGTVTLTNLGSYGVDTFAPIINPPQAAILAAGRITERAIASGGVLALRPTVHLTLAADHRILDGHQAATFLGDLRNWIENVAADRLDSPKTSAQNS